MNSRLWILFLVLGLSCLTTAYGQQKPDALELYKSGYYEEAMVIYQSLGHLNSHLADRLKMKIDEYKKYFE